MLVGPSRGSQVVLMDGTKQKQRERVNLDEGLICTERAPSEGSFE
jgi:hypothetical protein